MNSPNTAASGNKQGKHPACSTGPSPALVPSGDGDYTLQGTSVWITVGNISVYVRRTDEGVVIDLYPAAREVDECLGSTYAYFSEAIPETTAANHPGAR